MTSRRLLDPLINSWPIKIGSWSRKSTGRSKLRSSFLKWSRGTKTSPKWIRSRCKSFKQSRKGWSKRSWKSRWMVRSLTDSTGKQRILEAVSRSQLGRSPDRISQGRLAPPYKPRLFQSTQPQRGLPISSQRSTKTLRNFCKIGSKDFCTRIKPKKSCRWRIKKTVTRCKATRR